MKTKKNCYLAPELLLTLLYTESCFCLSQTGGISSTAEELDESEWSPIN